jgi:hypothetical protein
VGLAIFCEPQTSPLSAIAAQMETTTKYYQYKDLKKNEVRLFTISPAGSIDGQMVVHLKTVNMLRCPDYQVLSYTSGDPTNTPEITCDGSKLFVTENLRCALLALRESQSPSTYLWTAAICFNLQNPDESIRTSLRMKKILGQAVRTILWVGLEGCHSGTAFELILKLVSARREAFQDSPSSHLSPHPAENTLKRYREILSFPPSIAWKGLDDLMGRRIFER